MSAMPAPEAMPQVEKRVGAKARSSPAPRTGMDVSSGFAALEQLRAEFHGWTRENPPRLERVAHVVTGVGR